MLSLIAWLLCALTGGIIVILHIGLYLGLLLAKYKETKLQALFESKEDESPGLSVAVVVPARDEDSLLPRLLASLEHQDDKSFKIVLVNDRSKDNTSDILESFRMKYPDRVALVKITENPELPNGKLNALIEGVKKADSDLILFTDADCDVPPHWVSGIKRCFIDPSIGLILSPIETHRNNKLISHFHAFDHIFKFSYNAACAGAGLPMGGFGNNLAVRKKALEEMGGLESVTVTVTEDAALIAKMRNNTDRSIRALYSRSLTVLTEPQQTWTALTRQEVRWHMGGLFSKDFQTRLSSSYIYYFLLASVIAIPLGFFLPVLFVLPAVSFVTMTLMALLSGIFTKQPIKRYWLVLVPFILLSMGYNSLLTILALLRRPLTWKGDTLNKD
jgi:cellulose synthase/poly-beta-1,6-N-acetylglucosamine synthase-like glycosyltransferase